MSDQKLLEKISAKSSEHLIRDIVKNLDIKINHGEGFIHGLIYYVIFKNLRALSRRVRNKINSETKVLDVPVSIKYSDKDKCIFDGWAKEQVEKMNAETQTMIFICVFGPDRYSIAPVMAGVFNVGE